MEKNMQQKTDWNTQDVSEKKVKEIKVSKQVAGKLKRRWEALAKRQENGGIKVRSNRKITSISFVKDENGKVSVQVNLRNGRSLKDNAEEKGLEKFQKDSRRAYVRAKIAELLNKIKELGFAAVEGEIPAELREAVLKSMERANISTSYKGKKAEEAEAKRVSQNAARAADSTMKSVMELAAASNGKAPAAKIRLHDGVLTCSSSSPDYCSYTIETTPYIEEAYRKGYYRPTGREIPSYLSEGAQKAATAAIAQNADVLSHSLIDMNENNPTGNIKDVSGHLREGKQNSATVTATVKQADGTDITVNISGTVGQMGITKAALMANIWSMDDSKLPPEIREFKAQFFKQCAGYCARSGKTELAEYADEEKLKTLPLDEFLKKHPDAFNLLGNVSVKNILKASTDERPLSPNISSFIEGMRAAQRFDAENREKKNQENRLKQIEQALSLPESELSAEGLAIRQAAKELGLKDISDTRAVQTLCAHKDLFVQGNGGVYTSCAKNDVNNLRKLQLERKEKKQKMQYVNGVAKIFGANPHGHLSDKQQKMVETLEKAGASGKLWAIVVDRSLSPSHKQKMLTELVQEIREQPRDNTIALPARTEDRPSTAIDKEKEKEIRKSVNNIKLEEAFYLFKKEKKKEPLTPSEEKRINEWKAKGIVSLKDFTSKDSEKAKVRKVVDQISEKGAAKAYREKIDLAKGRVPESKTEKSASLNQSLLTTMKNNEKQRAAIKDKAAHER